MNSLKMVETSQNNLLKILLDITNMMNNSNDFSEIDENMLTVEKLSTIIKRLGETTVVESGSTNKKEKIVQDDSVYEDMVSRESE